MSKRDKLEFYWVMSDSLASEDINERRRALLALWSLYYDAHGPLVSPVISSSQRELRKLSRVVWEQLKSSGFFTSRRVAELGLVHKLIDLMAWELEGDQEAEARDQIAAVACRLSRRGHAYYRATLSRDGKGNMNVAIGYRAGEFIR